MKRKLLLATLCVVGALGFEAKAREDVTSTYLTDANLSSLDGWGNPGRTDWKTDGAVNVVEFWNWSNQFNFSQTAKLPAGYYRLAVNAFYRNSWTGDGTNNNMAWIYAGEKTQNVVALTAMSELSSYAGTNDLYRAATAFSQGKYSNEFDFNVTGEGTTDVTIGFKGTCPDGGWCILGPVTLYQYTADDYMEDYREKVSAAEALYSTPMYGDDLTVLKNAVVEEASLTTVDEVQSAINTLSNAISAANASITAYAAAIVPFNKLKTQAQEIADVEYKETVSGSHDTFGAAISAQQTAADNAANAAVLTSVIATLKSSIKTYIAGAEPKNEGEYFDITCLMENPDFDYNTITGWTKESTLNPNTRIQCNEFFGSAAFDFYQNVTGIPNGSYTLSMKAFQRPGGYNEVYTAYAGGTNNATAKIYVNNDESDVKNIMAEMNATRIYTDPSGEDAFNSDKQPTGAPGYIPNSMEGAAAWFAADKYKTTVAALVENGTLKLGFKDNAHSGDVWTLFDEFRLCYYGSSKLIYYKQYLPQLKSEVSADLANAAYANVLVSSEDEALDAALAATPAAESESAYETVINNLKLAQAAFRAAATSYDALVAAKASNITKISTNIGTGVFQYNETTNNSLFSAYETEKNNVDTYTISTSSTAAEVQGLVDALNSAVENYNNQALNAPTADKRYTLTIVEDGKTWNGNAVTFIAGARKDMGLYGIKYLTPANVNMNQALKFTAVDGETNTYKVSAFNVETGNEQYITTGSTYDGGNNTQIRTTDDAEKASWVKIQATETANQFKLLNVSDGNKVIANNDNEDMYTANSANFTIAEAAQASVTVNVASGKFATAIFPVAPGAIDGVKFYSCEAVSGEYVQMEEVAEPAANTPYILQASKDVNTTVSGWGLGKAIAETAGYLTGVYTAATIAASVEPTAEAEGAYRYVLQTQNGTQAFYKVGADFTATANKAYLTVPVAKTSEAKAFYFNFDDANAIEAISALTSDDVEGIYTVGGAKVNSLQKGINIVKMYNGETKKVFVK